MKVVKLWLTANPGVKENVERLGITEDKLLACFFPKRNNWTPAAEIKTDSVRVALTYTRSTATAQVTEMTNDRSG